MKTYLVLDTEATIHAKGNPFSKSNSLQYVGMLASSFSDSSIATYSSFPIEYDGEPYHRRLDVIRQNIEQTDLLIGFNLKYDIHWIRRYIPDIQLPKLFDCQLAYFLYKNQLAPYPSMDKVAEEFGLPIKPSLVAEYWSKGINTNQIPKSILEEYLQHDVSTTNNIFSYLYPHTRESKLLGLIHDDLKCLCDIEENGLFFDTETANQKAQELAQKYQQTIEALNGFVGTTINWNSPYQVSAALYGGKFYVDGTETVNKERKDGSIRTYERACKYPVRLPGFFSPVNGTELLKGGTRAERSDAERADQFFSTDEDTLKKLKGTKESKKLLNLLRLAHDQSKLLNTYYTGLPEIIKQYDWEPNVIHGSLNQAVAVTGRLSSSKPNQQNFDTRIKELFLARNDNLINIDVKGLEWVCAMYLSQDPVGMKEIIEGVDTHEENRKLYKLPDRLTAKRFNFRLIYGGSGYSYANDPDFMDISTSEKFWNNVIEVSYSKYKGLNKWHSSLVQEVVRSGMLVMPTGRRYVYKKKKNGDWPRTTILNYPVQGLGADILSIIRVSLWKRMKKNKIKSLLVNTVHDSIVIDAFNEEMNTLLDIIWSVFEDAPKNFEKLFKVPFNLPLKCEVLVGKNWGTMSEIKQGDIYAYQSS